MRLQPKPCEPKAFRCDRCGHEIGVVANGTAIIQNTVICLGARETVVVCQRCGHRQKWYRVEHVYTRS